MIKSKDSIITPALLTAFLEKENKDILNILLPFVLYLLPQSKDEFVDIDVIVSELENKFGFDSVPSNVVSKLLERAKKQEKYVYKKNRNFYVDRIYNRNEFNDKKTSITEKLDKVLRSLCSFLQDEGYEKEVTVERAQEYLLIFLNYYNYTLYDNIEQIRAVTISTNKERSNFWIARFILKEYEQESCNYEYVLDLVKGMLVAKAITYCVHEQKGELGEKLKNTVFYFDTSLLINALKIGDEKDNKATSELKELIEKNGGSVCTFEHYVGEVHGILTKYIASPEDRLGLSVQYFCKNDMGVQYVKAYRDTLEERLEQAKIEKREKPDSAVNINNSDWPIDYLMLKQKLMQYVDYSNDERGKEALDNDLMTLESISIMRYGIKGKQTIENCRAIFVTQNRDIVFATKDYFKEQQERNICLCISEVDLTALLWLSYGKNDNLLPQMKLMENVYAACCPSNEVMNEFLKIAKMMEEDESLPNSFTSLVKTGTVNLDSLAKRTDNDVANVTRETVLSIKDEYEERIRSEIRHEIRGEYKERKKEVEKKELETNEKAKAINKREITLQERERYLEERSKKIDNANKQSLERRKVNAAKKAEENAMKDRRKYEKKWKMVTLIMMGCLVLSGIWGLLYSINVKSYVGIVSTIIVAIFSIISMIQIKNDIQVMLGKAISRGGAKRFEKKYNEYYAEYMELID